MKFLSPAIACPRVAILALALLLSGCVVQNLQEPTITDTTVGWDIPDSRLFTASASVPDSWTVLATYVRYTRHFWPGPAGANEVVATETGPGSRDFVTSLLAVPAMARGDAVFYEWFLDYKLAAGGTEVLTARSGRQRFVNGCTQAEIDAELIGAATVLTTQFDTPTPHTSLPPLGYAVPPHFFVSVAGTGVGFAGVQGGFSLTTADLTSPDIVLYRPRPADPGETAPERFSAVTEPFFPDPPYTLIGGAYGIFYEPAKRPRLGCIPSDAWFVHESGYHLSNGGMVLTPPNDNGVRGSAGIIVPPAGAPLGIWHPRIWDLRIWLPAAGETVPSTAINLPGGLLGFGMPPGTFFQPQIFQ